MMPSSPCAHLVLRHFQFALAVLKGALVGTVLKLVSVDRFESGLFLWNFLKSCRPNVLLPS